MTVPSPARTQDSGPYEAASWWSVALLAACAFVFVLAELMPVGLIPLIASEFSVSEGAAGYVTVIYAWTVGPAAIVVTALTRRMDRRQLLLWIVAIFMLANVGAAIAPSFLVLLATRALAALAHGVFWSIVGPYAVRLVREKNAPRAMAVAFSGISIATVVGVPLGAAIGIALGWRMALALIAVASAAVLLAAWIFMPSVSSSNDRAEARLWTAARRRPLTVLWFATALAIGGHFAAFTYVAPFVTDGLMLSPSTLPILLFVFGAAGLAGNGLVGLISASKQSHAIPVATTGFALTGAFALTLTSFDAATIAVFALWGLSISAATTLFQSHAIALAGPAGDRASSIHVLVFNIGIGAGGYFGGLALDRVGPTAPMFALFVSASIATLTLCLDAALSPRASELKGHG